MKLDVNLTHDSKTFWTDGAIILSLAIKVLLMEAEVNAEKFQDSVGDVDASCYLTAIKYNLDIVETLRCQLYNYNDIAQVEKEDLEKDV